MKACQAFDSHVEIWMPGTPEPIPIPPRRGHQLSGDPPLPKPSVVVACGFAHQLVDGFVGEPCELGEKLTISHEEGPEHFWHGESPHGVPDVFEQLVFEKGGESGRTFRIA